MQTTNGTVAFNVQMKESQHKGGHVLGSTNRESSWRCWREAINLRESRDSCSSKDAWWLFSLDTIGIARRLEKEIYLRAFHSLTQQNYNAAKEENETTWISYVYIAGRIACFGTVVSISGRTTNARNGLPLGHGLAAALCLQTCWMKNQRKEWNCWMVSRGLSLQNVWSTSLIPFPPCKDILHTGPHYEHYFNFSLSRYQ